MSLVESARKGHPWAHLCGARRGVASKVVTMALESSTKRRYVAGVSLHSRTKITKEGHHAHVIIGNFDSEEEDSVSRRYLKLIIIVGVLTRTHV